MQPSKAAEIPEELFEYIVWQIPKDLFSGDKQHLAALGSVCRYWARICRQNLFDTLTLRTPDDAKRFYEVISAPTLPGLDPISTITQELEIAVENMDEPWLHLVFFLLPKLQKVNLCDVRPQRSGEKWPWRTLHPFLPRSIPSSLMPIQNLSLDHVHFPSRRTLLRLLSTIPLLESLEVLSPTYDVAEDLTTSPFHDRRYRIQCVDTHDLQLCLSLIPSSIACTRRGPSYNVWQTQRPILNEEDRKTLRDLCAIHAGAQRFRWDIWASSVDGEASKSWATSYIRHGPLTSHPRLC